MVPSLQHVLVLLSIIHVNSSLGELVTHRNSSTLLITFCHPIKCQGEITFCHTNYTNDVCRACRPGTFMPTYVDSSSFTNDYRIPSCISNSVLECPPEAKQVYNKEDVIPGCECDTARGYVGQDIYLCRKTSLPPCSPGKQLDLNDICKDCPQNTYKDTTDYGPCKKVKRCEEEDRVTISIATSTSNAVCGMKIGLLSQSKGKMNINTSSEKLKPISERVTTYSIAFSSQTDSGFTTNSEDFDSITRTTTLESVIRENDQIHGFHQRGLRNSTKSPTSDAEIDYTESENSSPETWNAMYCILGSSAVLMLLLMVLVLILLRSRHKRSNKHAQQVKLVVTNNIFPSTSAPPESIHSTETSAMVHDCVQTIEKISEKD